MTVGELKAKLASLDAEDTDELVVTLGRGDDELVFDIQDVGANEPSDDEAPSLYLVINWE